MSSSWGKAFGKAWGTSWGEEEQLDEFVGNIGEVVLDFDRWLALNKFPPRVKRERKPKVPLAAIVAVARQNIPAFGTKADSESAASAVAIQKIPAFGQDAFGTDYVTQDNIFLLLMQ